MKRMHVMILVVVAVAGGFWAGQVMPAEAGMSPVVAVESVQGAVGQVGGSWTYAQVLTAIDGVASDINAARTQLERGAVTIEQADTTLGGMTAAYGGLNTAIVAAPANTTYTPIKTQWAVLVAEYQSLKTTSAAMVTALEGVQ